MIHQTKNLTTLRRPFPYYSDYITKDVYLDQTTNISKLPRKCYLLISSLSIHDMILTYTASINLIAIVDDHLQKKFIFTQFENKHIKGKAGKKTGIIWTDIFCCVNS